MAEVDGGKGGRLLGGLCSRTSELKVTFRIGFARGGGGVAVVSVSWISAMSGVDSKVDASMSRYGARLRDGVLGSVIWSIERRAAKIENYYGCWPLQLPSAKECTDSR